MIRARLWEAQLPLRVPLTTARFTIRERRVVYIHLRDMDSGAEGWGEAAPLAEFGTETWEDCMDALIHTSQALASGRSWDLVLTDVGWAPAARCGLEMARLDFLSRGSGKRLADYLGESSPSKDVPVNALISGMKMDTLVASAKQAIQDGYTCVKMKVGACSWQEDLDRVSAVRETLDAGVLLRLDANGAWTRGEAEKALTDLAAMEIEYVEQPTSDARDLTAIGRNSPVPIAADESIDSPDALAGLCDAGGISIAILKPMALGGLTVASDCAKRALDAGIDVVFTSLLDSALARTSVLHLAASMADLCPRHQGLATGSLLGRDCIGPEPSRGRLSLPDGCGIGVDPESMDFTPDQGRVHS